MAVISSYIQVHAVGVVTIKDFQEGEGELGSLPNFDAQIFGRLAKRDEKACIGGISHSQ